MHTILVLTHQPGFGSAITSALDPMRWRVIVHEDAASAAPLFARKAIDAVVLDVDLNDARILHVFEEVRERASTVPLIVFSAGGHRQWEEEAYLIGVATILEKPVRARLLNHFLEKLVAIPNEPAAQQITAIAPPAQLPVFSKQPHNQLDSLRRFSSLLIHSLDAKALLQQAVQQVREALGTNRAVVFLRKPDNIADDDGSLHAMQGIGHEPTILQQFPLSLRRGLGEHLHYNRRILRNTSPEAVANRDILSEFHTLGSSIAVPILDRDTFVGILLLDERITGGTFTDEELLHLYRWLEELGTALRNCWRHEQLSIGHGLIDEIIASLGSGCVVVGTDREIVHTNAAALAILFPEDSRQRTKKTFLFNDLTQQLGSQIFQVIQTGQAVAPFKWTPPHLPAAIIGVRIVPFRLGADRRADAALLVLDDITEHERAVQLEVETNKLRLIRQMSWHLAHEIGNALTPISTLQQIVEEDEDEGRKELIASAGKSVRRITRLTQQMNFLSRDWDRQGGQTVKIAELLRSAYQEANTLCSGTRPARLELDLADATTVTGDTKALRHAFSELMLNALQANPENPTVTVRIEQSPEHDIAVEVQDSGPGFPSDIVEQIGSPFHSTRAVGLGLGLTVTRKIIENHLGTLEIPASGKTGPGIIRVKLPNS